MLLQLLLTTYSEAKYDIRPKTTSNTLSKPENGLLSAPHPGSEGVLSSDGESATGSATGSATPKSVCFFHRHAVIVSLPTQGKKGKKRR